MGIGEHQIKILTLEEYNKYKSNDRFLHEITFAHGVQGWEGYNKALAFYGIAESDFKISEELQEIAKKDYQKRKQDIIKNIKINDLAFVGMGMDFKPIDKDHIGNHRIRTYFKDNDGILCFVEFGACMNKNFLRCDHALKDTKNNSEWRSLRHREETEKRIYILEGLRSNNIEYTKQNILKLINKNFNTNFKDVKVFSYCLSTEDYNSISKFK